MPCLSTVSDPCDVIKHIFCNKSLYGTVIASIANSRSAREKGGTYCLFFKNPCDKSTTILKGQRILEIYEDFCKVCWCSSAEMCAGLAIANSEFFADVLLSYDQALQARNDSKKYCKSFKIPTCLFPNVLPEDRCVTISGETIIYLMCQALNQRCCD